MTPAWRERVPAGSWDAVVVGSGPNGLAAAITLAREGRRVLVVEAADEAGGGLRSAELTEPGFVHDLCATIFAIGAVSPFFRSLPPEAREFVVPPLALAHPFDDGRAAVLDRGVAATASGLGADGPAWSRTFAPLVDRWDDVAHDALGPPHLPRHPFRLARFGLDAVRSAASLARARFAGAAARALFAGLAAHGNVPLEGAASAAIGLVLGATAHAGGWPVARGGSGRIAAGLVAHLAALGGTLVTGARVVSLDELPPSRCALLDVTPRQLLAMAGGRLPLRYRRALARFRPGAGVFKVDYALEAATPWRAAECARAATVHLGGSFEETAASEAAVARGEAPERPFVILVQPTLVDPSRAPAGRHVAWAYGHVPNGWTGDLLPRIEAQIERFAPGFRDVVRARSVWTPARLEVSNPNHAGGDIGGGAADLRQLLARPVLSLDPYATPLEGVFLCSSSTPPGAGAHGLCGVHAARSALRRGF
ncbi:MAG TPA: NAD(P)/FAD-dependent oxidoreductase [Vicinamibacteria bacterium]|nr:NAD(P)/FAD-dependent oxidoreductase [Vicinamibacteria bacterium]